MHIENILLQHILINDRFTISFIKQRWSFYKSFHLCKQFFEEEFLVTIWIILIITIVRRNHKEGRFRDIITWCPKKKCQDSMKTPFVASWLCVTFLTNSTKRLIFSNLIKVTKSLRFITKYFWYSNDVRMRLPTI